MIFENLEGGGVSLGFSHSVIQHLHENVVVAGIKFGALSLHLKLGAQCHPLHFVNKTKHKVRLPVECRQISTGKKKKKRSQPFLLQIFYRQNPVPSTCMPGEGGGIQF